MIEIIVLSAIGICVVVWLISEACDWYNQRRVRNQHRGWK
jgi:uncharacterized protein YggT (Ycf19 family)